MIHEPTFNFFKKIREICEQKNYRLGLNRQIESDGVVLQIYLEKHGLTVKFERVEDPYYEGEFIDSPYIDLKEAESLIPAIKSSFSKIGVLDRPRVFSVSNEPSYFIKLAYPEGVSRTTVKNHLSDKS